MQISTARGNGTASVTNGSTLVRAAVGVDWSLVKAGNWFKKAGSNAYYTVAADATLVSGQWQFNLNGNYAEPTNAIESYIIQKDFTDEGAPIFVAGDTDVLLFVNRVLQVIYELISSLVGTGGGVASGLRILNASDGLVYTIGVAGAGADAHITLSDIGTPP